MNIRSFIPSPRAFTLVEVLLGIIILAIGLLGLAAVFPLVVKEQRDAQDTVIGTSAARGAESYLRGHQGFLSTGGDIVGLNAPSGKSGWAALSSALYQTALANKTTQNGRVNWSTLLNENTSPKTAIYGANANQKGGGVSGTLCMFSSTGSPSSPSLDPYDVLIKPADRLMPQGAASPLFVWDILPSLAAPIDINTSIATSTPPLRVTVFIRRIDTGIRVPAGSTLAEAVSNNIVVPVAADADGLPTLDGNGTYSTFLYTSVQTAYRRFGSESGPFNVIRFSAQANTPVMAAIRQIGQQLVDVDGNVYTVIALPDERGTDIPYPPDALPQCVVIEPGIPAGVLQAAGGKSTSSAPRSGYTLELICTPQIPASISTFLIRP